MAKRFGEVLCRMYAEKIADPMTTIVLRPTNVYGPKDDFESATSHVITALFRKVVERKDLLEVWCSGEEVRDVIYVIYIEDALIVVMEIHVLTDTINIGH